MSPLRSDLLSETSPSSELPDPTVGFSSRPSPVKSPVKPPDATRKAYFTTVEASLSTFPSIFFIVSWMQNAWSAVVFLKFGVTLSLTAFARCITVPVIFPGDPYGGSSLNCIIYSFGSPLTSKAPDKKLPRLSKVIEGSNHLYNLTTASKAKSQANL